MALYNGKPVMIGAKEVKQLHEFEDKSLWRSNTSYFEVFNPTTEEWSDLKRHPFFPEGTKSYYGGTSVTKEDSFLIFGGHLYIYEGKNFKNVSDLTSSAFSTYFQRLMIAIYAKF